MHTYRRPFALFLVTAIAAGSAWAQHMGEGRGLGQMQGRPSGALPQPQSNGNFVNPPRMQASSPMMRSRGDRAGKVACMQRISIPPQSAVLRVEQIEFDGGAQCRVKIMRSNGLVQVLSAQVER
ncbi:hypothetical protein [Lysobacter soyae]|uniref:Uncharacterized protein n=1 Tax=Lysobacter soyae TaxID=2764185 RepID=A0ABX8WQB5_9GAMM|nr:hypothetical protein [Lysobacter sp. CJ11]QYR52779.1 hypothetical protein H8L67_09395 [Lysobacter sp. CJ11]